MCFFFHPRFKRKESAFNSMYGRMEQATGKRQQQHLLCFVVTGEGARLYLTFSGGNTPLLLLLPVRKK